MTTTPTLPRRAASSTRAGRGGGGGGSGLPSPGPLARSISFGHSVGDISHSHLHDSSSSSRYLVDIGNADDALLADSLPPSVNLRGGVAVVGASTAYLHPSKNSIPRRGHAASNGGEIPPSASVVAINNHNNTLINRYDPATFYTGQNETPAGLLGPGVLEAASRSAGGIASTLPASVSSSGFAAAAAKREQLYQLQRQQEQQHQREQPLYPSNSLPRNYTMSDSFAPNSETTV